MKPHPRNARRSGLSDGMDRLDLNTRRTPNSQFPTPKQEGIGSWGVGSWELIGLLQRLNGRRALLNRRAAELRDGPADLHGCVKDPAHRDAPCEAMASDRFQACRGNAAAVAAIGIAAELTRQDAPLHVGGK